MFISIDTSTIYTKELVLARWKQRALVLLNYYKFGADELLLDEYLKENYKFNLVHACKLLLARAKISWTDSKNIIIYWNDNWYDKLASTINNGIGKVKGSKILRYLFRY